MILTVFLVIGKDLQPRSGLQESNVHVGSCSARAFEYRMPALIAEVIGCVLDR